MTPRDAHLRHIRRVRRAFERFTRAYPRSPGDPAPIGSDHRLGNPAPTGQPGTDRAIRHRPRLGDPAPIGRRYRAIRSGGTSHARKRAETSGWPRFHAPPGSRRSAGTIFGGTGGAPERTESAIRSLSRAASRHGSAGWRRPRRPRRPRNQPPRRMRRTLALRARRDDNHDRDDDRNGDGHRQLLPSSWCSHLGTSVTRGIRRVPWSSRKARRNIVGHLIHRAPETRHHRDDRRAAPVMRSPMKRATTAPADAPPAPGCDGAPPARARGEPAERWARVMSVSRPPAARPPPRRRAPGSRPAADRGPSGRPSCC